MSSFTCEALIKLYRLMRQQPTHNRIPPNIPCLHIAGGNSKRRGISGNCPRAKVI